MTCLHCDHTHNPNNPCYELPALTLVDFCTTIFNSPPRINDRKPRHQMFDNLAQPVRHKTREGKGVVGRLMKYKGAI